MCPTSYLLVAVGPDRRHPVKAVASRAPRFAAGSLDRMSPARQRLGKQARSIVERNAPFQTRDRGRGRAVVHPRARLAMQFVWYGAPFSSVAHPLAAAEVFGIIFMIPDPTNPGLSDRARASLLGLVDRHHLDACGGFIVSALQRQVPPITNRSCNSSFRCFGRQKRPCGFRSF